MRRLCEPSPLGGQVPTDATMQPFFCVRPGRLCGPWQTVFMAFLALPQSCCGKNLGPPGCPTLPCPTGALVHGPVDRSTRSLACLPSPASTRLPLSGPGRCAVGGCRPANRRTSLRQVPLRPNRWTTPPPRNRGRRARSAAGPRMASPACRADTRSPRCSAALPCIGTD